jgi:AraC-like DNA-binding protein
MAFDWICDNDCPETHPVILNREDREVKQKLDAIMKQEKLFLNPSLNLHTLSCKLNCSSKELSRIINSAHTGNFRDYINSYRIEEVLRQLHQKDQSRFSILGIAFDAGFNSKSSFYRVFKAYTGKTPTEHL